MTTDAPKCFAKYHGNGGYPSDKERADKLFVKDQEYLVIGGYLGKYDSTLKLERFDGLWNSALFDVDLNNAPLTDSYKLYYVN